MQGCSIISNANRHPIEEADTAKGGTEARRLNLILGPIPNGR